MKECESGKDPVTNRVVHHQLLKHQAEDPWLQV
jgi:hypothetical protein